MQVSRAPRIAAGACSIRASRSYFSRLTGKHPKELFPKIRLTILPARHFAMPEAATAKLRRRKSGEAMRKLMQEMIFASRPEQTLYAALCDAADIFGRRRRLLSNAFTAHEGSRIAARARGRSSAPQHRVPH